MSGDESFYDDDDAVTPSPGLTSHTPNPSSASSSDPWATDSHGPSDPSPSPSASSFALGSEEAISAFSEAARAGWEAENRAAAQRFKAAHELMVQCLEHPDCALDLGNPRPGYTVVDPGEMAVAHLIRMYPITTRDANILIMFAADLHFRYPAILQAMSDGRMCPDTAKMLAEQMRFVDDSVVHAVQQEVVDAYLAAIESGERPARRTVRNRTDKIMTRHDRDAVRARRKDAVRDRCVRVSPGQDGMASLYAVLRADEAAMLAEAIEAKVSSDRADDRAAAAAAAAAAAEGTVSTDTDAGSATDVDAATGSDSGSGNGNGNGNDSASEGETIEGDEPEGYSIGDRRADAMMWYFFGDRAPTCDDANRSANQSASQAAGQPGDPERPGGTADSEQPGPAGAEGTVGKAVSGLMLRPRITVFAPTGGNSTGWNDRARVEFARTGEAALQSLLDMLACSDGATIQRVDPAIGADDDPDAELRYRPGAALSHRIRLRDRTCRHPGCTMPAEGCDLDHVVPFDHDNPEKGGRTVEKNLVCLCRFHHRFKTFISWDYRLEPDGTLVITAPGGTSMYTRPDGPLAEFRREQAAAEAAAWERQQQRSPDPNKAAATGGSNTCDHTEQTSWSRRQARVNARRAAERAANAADWQVKDDAADAREKEGKNRTRAKFSLERRWGMGEIEHDGHIITVVYDGLRNWSIPKDDRRFPDYTDYLDVEPCDEAALNIDSFDDDTLDDMPADEPADENAAGKASADDYWANRTVKEQLPLSALRRMYPKGHFVHLPPSDSPVEQRLRDCIVDVGAAPF